jgi:hypothetical protein
VSERRLPPLKAIERLLTYFPDPRDICERIERAVHAGRLPLYRDGIRLMLSEIKEVNPRVVAEQQADGSWCYGIVTPGQPRRGRYLGMRETEDGRRMVTIALPPEPVWELDAEGIEALRGAQAAPERWTKVVDDEMARLRNEKSPLLSGDLQDLYDYLTACVQDRTGALLQTWTPPNWKRFRRRIRDRLG